MLKLSVILFALFQKFKKLPVFPVGLLAVEHHLEDAGVKGVLRAAVADGDQVQLDLEQYALVAEMINILFQLNM